MFSPEISLQTLLASDDRLSPPDLSIVFGTYNRVAMLRDCLASIRNSTGAYSYEIIVVDGGSTDGSLEFLREQPDVYLIEHGELRGCVAAYNEGFSHATGRYVAYVNDDLTLAAGTLEAACSIMDTSSTVGIVSIPYRNPGGKPTHPTTTVNGKRLPFASFGVLRRELGEQAGWFDGFSHFYGDCYLSVSIQRVGYCFAWLNQYWFIAEHRNADNALRGNKRWTADVASIAKLDGERWQAWQETLKET